MKTGQPAFDSGMRGSSKPKDKASGDGKKSPGKVTRFEAEPEAKGGYVHHVTHEGSGGMEAGNYQGPKEHVYHADKQSAIDHFSTMLDAMGGGEGANAEKEAKGGKQATSANKGTGDK